MIFEEPWSLLGPQQTVTICYIHLSCSLQQAFIIHVNVLCLCPPTSAFNEYKSGSQVSRCLYKVVEPTFAWRAAEDWRKIGAQNVVGNEEHWSHKMSHLCRREEEKPLWHVPFKASAMVFHMYVFWHMFLCVYRSNIHSM